MIKTKADMSNVINLTFDELSSNINIADALLKLLNYDEDVMNEIEAQRNILINELNSRAANVVVELKPLRLHAERN